MREINFVEVGMENFGPYIDRMILMFQNNALTLLTGPNGIGKTMALDALPFTLFGSTSKGARGDDVVNNVVGRNCYTWVQFYVDKDSYLVERYHKYTKLGNTVTISKNGKEPYKKGQKEVLPEVEKLLCPKKSFMNTLMFGQKIKDFFTDLVDSDKKEIFRKILNLDRYQLFYDRTKEILSELKESIIDLSNRIIIAERLRVDADEQLKILNKKKKDFYIERDDNIKHLEQAIKSNKRMLDNWEDQLLKLKENQQDWKDLENKLLEFEAEEEKIDASIKSEKEKLENQKQLKITQLMADGGKAISEINDHAHIRTQERKDYSMKLIENIGDQVQKLLEDKNKIDIDINKHLDYIHNSQIQADELKVGLQGSTCPTCLQDITKQCETTLKNKIKQFNDGAFEEQQLIDTKLKPTRKKILAEVETLSDKKIKAKEIMELDVKDIEFICIQDKQNADQKLNSALNKVDKLSEIMFLKIKENHQNKLKPIYTERDQIMKKAREHRSLDKDIDEMQMTITTIERTNLQKLLDLKAKESLEFDDTQIFSYEKKKRLLIIEVENLFNETETKRDDVEIFEFWKLAFSSSGIPSMLIDEAVPFMNKKVSEYLDKLTNGRYIVSFDTLAETKKGEFRDKISVNVLDTHTRASSRIQLSGGQTRIIDIATILTLGDLQSNIQDVKFNILLFDEIFDSLDEENIGFVSKVLSNMKVGKSIYLISHRHEDQLEADEVLTLN
jgi:DNA repair exonuclease SbcCD ATPase subunit